MIPRLSIGGSELLAVPAVHNRAVFAEQVNRACRDEALRPEAVAVELSHDAVTAVVAWLKELGVAPGCAGTIPCMLGLVKANRRIHARHQETALRLQELHGVPLHRISPLILRRQLNFAAISVLCLSTTDSIIEAIRSALELDLPVYGIDLGEVANAERGQPMIQDPILAQLDLVGYVERNESPCVIHRDAIVDGRREWVMAARLKSLLRRHRCVLFTGGLGHWQRLRQLLSDDALAPAAEPINVGLEVFNRVVVAPSLAVHQMDLFPDLTPHYESLRQLPTTAPERLMDYPALYRMKLASAYECAEPRNREAAAALAQFLTNLCAVQQCLVPDLFMTLCAAGAIISPAFAKRLGKVLITQALNWAQPDQWPNLPYLRRIESGSEARRFADAGDQAVLQSEGKRSQPFYLTHLSESEDRIPGMRLPPLPEPETDKDPMHPRQFVSAWVWPPCETLLFKTAYEAGEIGDRNAREEVPEPYAGSLQEGVDIKASLRAIIRGERRVQVKVRSACVQNISSSEENQEPAVLIFEPETVVKDGSWGVFMAGDSSDIREFVRDPERYDQVVRSKGDEFVASVHFSTSRTPEERLSPHVSYLKYLHGIVVFGNPCLSPLQSARWLEGSGYAACPNLRQSTVGSLFEFYRREYHVTLDHERWASSLIRIALPYAKRRVMVVLPPHQIIHPPVFREASARRIKLEFLPLAHFPKERIEAIRHQYLVHPTDVNAMAYPEAMQAAFGESPKNHLDSLPDRIRAQLEPAA
jgi:hypothetical protein